MHIIGRTGGDGSYGHVGRYRARDGSTGERVGLDFDRPHVATVVGKRGSGKSYTLGVLAEELARTDGIAPILADPMGTFRTLGQPVGDGAPVPATVVDPHVAAAVLGPDAWCRVLGLDPTDGAGTLVWQAAEVADTLTGMREFVADASASDAARRAADNHLRMAASWDVFASTADETGTTVTRELDTDAVTVLDMAGLGRAPMNAVLAAVARRCYDARVADEFTRLPWLLVDEAHAFFDGVAADALRTLCTRGRQPGVSLVVATQRPTALPDTIHSQTDLLAVHRLTSQADRAALADTRPSYMHETIAERMPTTTGAATVVDDATESVHAIQVRERATPHGGSSPRVSDIETAE